MSYATFEFCNKLYPDLEEKDYDFYAWETGHEMDRYTAGVDGVKKLKIAFPVDEDDAEAVKRCFAHVLYTMVQIGKAKQEIAKSTEGVEINGKMAIGAISSISSGSESISFATNSDRGELYAAATDTAVRNKVIQSVIREYLSNVSDRYGVNLLYGGRYPCIVTR